MEKGTYALVMALKSEATIAVGKLGRFTFQSGYHVYFGSARRGLSGRVSRHLRADKRSYWHIDYLVQFANIVEVWYDIGDERRECLWCQVARRMPNTQILIPGFGSSDCRCPAHLIYFSSPPSFELFRQMLEGRGYWANKASPVNFLSSAE